MTITNLRVSLLSELCKSTLLKNSVLKFLIRIFYFLEPTYHVTCWVEYPIRSCTNIWICIYWGFGLTEHIEIHEFWFQITDLAASRRIHLKKHRLAINMASNLIILSCRHMCIYTQNCYLLYYGFRIFLFILHLTVSEFVNLSAGICSECLISSFLCSISNLFCIVYIINRSHMDSSP